jgi:hypothetical protein
MLTSLKEKSEEELSPKSKMNKKILMDIKESEKQIDKDLRKIKDIQINFSLTQLANVEHNLDRHIKERANGEARQPQDLVMDEIEKMEDFELRERLRFESYKVPAFG